MALNAGRCVGPERLAEYADGVLAPEDRADVERHLAECADCRAVVAETMAFLQTSPVAAASPRVVPFTRRRWVTGALAGLAAAAALVLAVRVVRPQWLDGMLGPRTDRPELQELIAAVAKEPTRPVEGRLTGGFKYAPPPSPTRGPGDREVSPDVKIAAARLEKLAQDSDSSASLAALGTASLAIGDFDKAVQLLEAATLSTPGNSAFQSDLAAAFIARARRDGRAEDLAKALASAEKAIRIRADLQEALFNRALALQELHLRDLAIGAWREYLQKGPSGDWAAEARRQLEQLQRTSALVDGQEPFALQIRRAARERRLVDFVALFPVRSREFAEDSCGAEWADFVHDRNLPSAELLLEQCADVATALYDLGRDKLGVESIARLRDVTRDDSVFRAQLTEARREYHTARSMYLNDEILAAEPRFNRAALMLERARDPLAVMARYHVALSRFNAGEIESALNIYRDLRDVALARGYQNLLGQVLWKMGLVAASRAEFDESIALYRESLRVFESTHETENAANLHSLLAEDFKYLGDLRMAWDEHLAALTLLTSRDSFRIRHQILIQCALTSLKQDLPEAAWHFQNAAIANAGDWKQPAALTTAYLHRARAHHLLHRDTEASVDLREARSWQVRIPDANFSRRYELEIMLVEGEILRQQNAGLAVELLRTGEQRMRDFGAPTRLPELLLSRARAELMLGNAAAAEQDLRAGIALFERHRRQVGEDAFRVSYLDSVWGLFEDLVSLQLAVDGKASEALFVAERSRSRALLDRLAPEQRIVPEETAQFDTGIIDILPDRTAILFFVVLPDRVAIWALSRSETRVVESRVTAAELARQVRQFRSACERDAVASIRELSRTLYDELLKPVEAIIQQQDVLAIIPDGPLFGLSFSALEDPDGIRVVERRGIAMAPSLSVLGIATRRGKAAAVPVKAMVVGDPRISGAATLTESGEEARLVAFQYPDSYLLTGSAATKQQVLARIGSVDVAHFATHAVANVEYPGLSRLLLTPDADGRGGAWFAGEIASRGLSNLRIVVLAACSSADGRYSRGEGVLSLARPFLAAGVPSVVATLWDVDDRASRLLFEEFHRRLRLGETTIEALRQSQLVLAHSSDRSLSRPSAWAGIVVVGAVSAAVTPLDRGNVRRSSDDD